ncbi:tRNA methyltransferase ppm2, partial [Neurospora sp. IMI 360204]
CDLRDLSTLQASLTKAVGGDLSSCTFLFVAEVSITYMETPGADAVIEWASTLGDSEFVLLEQLLPSGPTHPFASTMLSHFNKLNTPIKSVDVYPTVASQMERFRSRGWDSGDVRVWTLWEAWADAEDTFVNAAERRRLEEVEPFDEWEEFALFASHYCVVRARTVAREGQTKEERGIPNGRELGVPVEKVKVRWDDVPGQRGQRRFAAGAVLPGSRSEKSEEVKLLNVMGLGTKSRLQNCDVYGRKREGDGAEIDGTEQEVPFTFREGGPSTRMCHSLTDLGHAQLLVGGRASPSTPLKDCWLLEKSNGSEGEWAWKRTHDLPIPLYRHSVTRLGKTDMALLAGGRGVADIFPDWLLYEPKLGWIRCEITGDVKPTSVYGATLACLRQEQDSFSGVFAGGLSDDGLIADQLLAWNLDVSDSSKPVVRFVPLQVKSGAGGPEEALSRQLLTRFGASCLPQSQTDFLVLGGVIKDHLLNLEDEILLCSLSGTELTITQRLVPEAANAETPSHPGPLLLVGTSPVVTPNDRHLVIMGGGATCFSMGTFWNKGISTLELPIPTAIGDGSSPITTHGWTHERTVDIIPGEPRSLPLRNQASDSAEGNVNGSVSVRTQPIPRVKLENAEDFARIVREGRPVVLEGLNLGDCVSKWREGEYIVEKVGTDRKVVIHESTTPAMDFTTKNFRYVTTEFGDFMKRVEKGDRLYLRALSTDKPAEKPAVLSDDFPLLATDFVLPPELALVDERLFSSVLRVSGPVNMWLHYDVMANVYCQIGGSKRMILFPPSDVEHLSFAPGASSSSIDVFSTLFGESSDSRYLAQATHPHEAVVTPGDVLFLPPLWLHTATPTSESSIAVNVFFRDLDGGCYAAGKDVYGNRDLAAYQKSRIDVTRIANSFQKLPVEAREFYLLRLADELRMKAKGAQ